MTHGAGPNVVFAKASGDPTALSRRIAAATHSRRHDRQEHPPADRCRPSARSRPSTWPASAGSRRRSRSCSPPRRWACSSPWRWPSAARSSRRWPRSARRSREVGAFLWSEAVLVLGAGLALAAAARLAAGGDARRDAAARLRPAARPPRGALGFLAELGGGGARGALIAAALVASRCQAAAARGDTARAVNTSADPKVARAAIARNRRSSRRC